MGHSLFAGVFWEQKSSFGSWVWELDFIVIIHDHVTLTFGSKAEKDTHYQEEFVVFSCFQSGHHALGLLTFNSLCRRFGILVTNNKICWALMFLFFRCTLKIDKRFLAHTNPVSNIILGVHYADMGWNSKNHYSSSLTMFYEVWVYYTCFLLWNDLIVFS